MSKRKTVEEDAVETAETDDAGLTIAGELGHLAALTNAQREGFQSSYTDAECDKSGAESQGAAVLREGKRALLPVCGYVRTNGASLRYGSPRLRFALECLAELEHQLAVQGVGKAGGDEAGAAVDAARAAATAVRNELVDALKNAAGSREREQPEFAKARGAVHTDDELQGSLDKLAKLARKWLKRKDPALAALLAAHFVTAADADHAERAAAALQTARSRALGKKKQNNDSPATNRIEGRVTLELGVLDAALHRRKAQDKLVPAMTLGPTLRRLLHPGKAAAEPVTPPANAPTSAPANATGRSSG